MQTAKKQTHKHTNTKGQQHTNMPAIRQVRRQAQASKQAGKRASTRSKGRDETRADKRGEDEGRQDKTRQAQSRATREAKGNGGPQERAEKAIEKRTAAVTPSSQGHNYQEDKTGENGSAAALNHKVSDWPFNARSFLGCPHCSSTPPWFCIEWPNANLTFLSGFYLFHCWLYDQH